jgi:hypothetical protein
MLLLLPVVARRSVMGSTPGSTSGSVSESASESDKSLMLMNLELSRLGVGDKDRDKDWGWDGGYSSFAAFEGTEEILSESMRSDLVDETATAAAAAASSPFGVRIASAKTYGKQSVCDGQLYNLL